MSKHYINQCVTTKDLLTPGRMVSSDPMISVTLMFIDDDTIMVLLSQTSARAKIKIYSLYRI